MDWFSWCTCFVLNPFSESWGVEIPELLSETSMDFLFLMSWNSESGGGGAVWEGKSGKLEVGSGGFGGGNCGGGWWGKKGSPENGKKLVKLGGGLGGTE